MEPLKLKIVILVDDDPISNFITKEIIEEIITPEIEISIAVNGSEALELVKECISKNISILYILLDLNMPVMNGFEFLSELADVKDKPEIKIIILSSSSSDKDRKQAIDYSVHAYISKPLTQEKLELVLSTK